MDAALHLLHERLTLLIVALLLSLVVSGILRPARPAIAWLHWVQRLAAKLNRSNRSSGTRVYRGLILLLFLSVLVVGLGMGLQWLAAWQPWLVGLQLLLMAYLLPLKHLYDEAAALARAVKLGQMPRAKGLADALARRAHERLDAQGLLRVAVEYVAENWNDKLVAAVCWYLLLGLPGLLLLRMVNMLDGLIGHRAKELIAFGWATAKLDDVLQYVPARLAGLLLCMAACFIPKGKPLEALATIARQAGRTASPNSGWPLAAMAGAIGVSLCGPRRVQGAVIEDAWIGRGSARIQQSDMRRALLLYVVAGLLLLLLCAIALLLLPAGA